MLTEIDKDFFCSANRYNNRFCNNGGHTYNLCSSKCSCCHHKYTTPEQYKEEYGEEWADNDAVYYFVKDDWLVISYGKYKELYSTYLKQIELNDHAKTFIKYPCICACTPFGKPPQDWRPE